MSYGKFFISWAYCALQEINKTLCEVFSDFIKRVRIVLSLPTSRQRQICKIAASRLPCMLDNALWRALQLSKSRSSSVLVSGWSKLTLRRCMASISFELNLVGQLEPGPLQSDVMSSMYRCP